jgi:drug/metabolite transporter (DMT)-like permease
LSHLQPTTRGIVAMLVAMGCFSLMDVSLKALSAHYPPLQVAALRGLTAWPLVLVHVCWQRQLHTLWRVRWPLHLLRGVLTVGMLSLFAHALQSLSLTSAYVLFFIAPVLVTLLSGPVLGERVPRASVWAVVLGLAGVWVALRPGPEFWSDVWRSSASLAVLAAATGYAVAAVTGRLLTRTDSSASLVFWTTSFLAAGASALAWPGWQSVQVGHAGWLALLAVTGMAGQIAIVEAFRHGEAAVVAPFEYSALAWGVVFDALLWQLWPDRQTWVGAALVVAGGVVLVRAVSRPPAVPEALS